MFTIIFIPFICIAHSLDKSYLNSSSQVILSVELSKQFERFQISWFYV